MSGFDDVAISRIRDDPSGENTIIEGHLIFCNEELMKMMNLKALKATNLNKCHNGFKKGDKRTLKFIYVAIEILFKP